MNPSHSRTPSLSFAFFAAGICLLAAATLPAQQPPPLTIHWDKVTVVSRPRRRCRWSSIRRCGRASRSASAAYKAVKELGADYVRYVPWLPYPRLAVAELEPPTPEKTSWDFTLIDPMTKDFLAATEGHSTIINFSTIPAWLFKTPQAGDLSRRPQPGDWNYTQGTELRDPTGKELGDYYARLVSWYVNGGFTDENGVRHESGYHYKLPYWEVLNEVDFEHSMTPEQYTERYDAIVSAIHKVSPETKFMGLALAAPGADPQYVRVLPRIRANHRPGIPLDMISYHFYASPAAGETLDSWQYTFFDQEAGFLNTVRYVEAIRKRLSPKTQHRSGRAGRDSAHRQQARRQRAAADSLLEPCRRALRLSFHRAFAAADRVVGESQLVGYPTQFPSVSMMDWTHNEPNARFWVLKLIKDTFHPATSWWKLQPLRTMSSAQAFVTPRGPQAAAGQQAQPRGRDPAARRGRRRAR